MYIVSKTENGGLMYQEVFLDEEAAVKAVRRLHSDIPNHLSYRECLAMARRTDGFAFVDYPADEIHIYVRRIQLSL